MKHVRWLSSLLLTGSLLAGCSSTGGDNGPGLPSEADDLVSPDSKSDTGYFSTLATELEGEMVGVMTLKADHETRRALEETIVRQRYATEQMKFAKNQLNAELLHLNLTAGEISESDAREEGGNIVITYKMRVESIVSFDELREAGIDDPATLTNKSYAFQAPADPNDLYTRLERAGVAVDVCAAGFDAGDLTNYNYFYYFKPDKEGCAAAVPLIDGSFTIHSLLPVTNSYPEYDLLVADGKVTAVAFFGAAGHEETVPSHDWGVTEWKDFEAALLQRGFSEQGVADSTSGKGKHFVRNREGLEESVDVISPYDLAALNHDTDGLFGRMVSTHEIVLYMGHSFYGSLSVLDQESTYAPGVYQIFFIGSCWSYEYYTKQIFKHKATPEDPTGWALADVVNDTEVGWFHNMGDFARIVLTNVLAGAEHQGRDMDRRFHWQNIITAMNSYGVDAQRYWNTDTHEIMGVSGVRTNRFDPDATEPPPEPGDWDEMALRVESQHDYGTSNTYSFDVNGPEGATEMRLHFEKIDTEPGYDFVKVFDGSGNEIASYDGIHEDLTTPVISGSRAVVKLISDSSVTQYGFAIDKVFHKGGGGSGDGWTSQRLDIESTHPYGNTLSQDYQVSSNNSGAREVRLHFSKIDTEAKYDFVEIIDASGNLVVRYDGVHEDLTTPAIAGNSVTVRLLTDYSVPGWGFELDSLESR